MQRCDVGEADERLGCLRDRVEVEQRDHLRRAIAAAHGLDRVDFGVGECGLQVAGTHFRAAGVPAVLLERSGHELDAVTLRLPPADTTLDLGARLRRAPRRHNADRGAGGAVRATAPFTRALYDLYKQTTAARTSRNPLIVNRLLTLQGALPRPVSAPLLASPSRLLARLCPTASRTVLTRSEERVWPNAGVSHQAPSRSPARGASRPGLRSERASRPSARSAAPALR